jgi:hypothetical protein
MNASGGGTPGGGTGSLLFLLHIYPINNRIQFTVSDPSMPILPYFKISHGMVSIPCSIAHAGAQARTSQYPRSVTRIYTFRLLYLRNCSMK